MVEIAGHAPPRFAAVKDAFAANFDAGDELGARFALPGNVDNYGAAMPATLNARTPQWPTTDKGRLRVQFEDELRLRAPRLRSFILRAGDFFGTGSGVWFPSRFTSFVSSMMTIMRSVAAATIFSRSNAPPRPLISSRVPVCTSSAPSIVRSINGCSPRSDSLMPSPRACAAVRSEVGIPTTRNPSRTRGSATAAG